jgi:hypothetical protein
MTAALASEGVPGFVIFLAVLLAMMLVAVIRAPRWDGSSSEDATQSQPATAARSQPADVQARAAATIARAAAVLPARRPPGPQSGDTATMRVPAGATSQPGYTARHASGPAPGEDALRRPQAYGVPPWEPAPKPPGI